MATAYEAPRLTPTGATGAPPRALPPGRLLITIATYNEMENLPQLIAEILQTVPEADVLVVDDNSPDGTGEWCEELAPFEPRLHCLRRAGKLGLGTATIDAMRYAMQHGYEFALNMDADLSHQPCYLTCDLGRYAKRRRQAAGRCDDRLALRDRWGRGGLALAATSDELGRQSIHPPNARPTDP